MLSTKSKVLFWHDRYSWFVLNVQNLISSFFQSSHTDKFHIKMLFACSSSLPPFFFCFFHWKIRRERGDEILRILPFVRIVKEFFSHIFTHWHLWQDAIDKRCDAWSEKKRGKKGNGTKKKVYEYKDNKCEKYDFCNYCDARAGCSH